MKLLTQEEKDANYKATIKGGLIGGVGALALGIGGVVWANRRFAGFRQLTLPFKAFLVVSTSTFGSIVAADRASDRFDLHRNKARLALLQHQSEYEKLEQQKPLLTQARDWAAEHRYGIVFGCWLASMGVSLAIVRRNPYLTTAQKVVQARVYAQGLTVATLLGSFAIEARDATLKKGKWETIMVLDPNDPLHKHLIEKRIHHERYEGEDQWMEVIATEEKRLKERQAEHEAERKTIKEAEARAHAKHTQSSQ